MRRLFSAAVIATAVVLAGCSTTVTGSPAPTGAGTDSGGTAASTTDPVAWADKVCGSLLPLQHTLSTAPQVEQSDPTATVKALSDFLGRSEAAIDQAASALDAAGASPVPGGDDVVTKIKATLATVRTSFDQAKTAIDKIDPSDPTTLITALPQAVAPLQELSKLKDPSTDLKSSPEFDAAAAKAPNCQALKKTG